MSALRLAMYRKHLASN